MTDKLKPATLEEAWDLLDSRRFLHGHRESLKESFEVVMKDMFGSPPPVEHVMVSKTLDLVRLDCEIDTLREKASKGGIAVVEADQLEMIASILDAVQPPEGLSKWPGWDQSNPPWSEAKHKDAICYAAFGDTWSMEDAAALIGFIEATWRANK
ncbi:hypothetical protein J5277_09695 [Rhizobium sp. 16-449-1b]|uniref:hypothetical protein n=1 Tax=Rhizobium sp. 16-449-1b TaxID=2819989 RepID=UPI001ADA09F4|nr:hypothetical protein [Rhizobium sp. 16-449-1b]MBO9194378.1 hypothetical protein [Rhizobium sp. 16-449-1b]